MENMELDKALGVATDFVVNYSFQIFGAMVILIVGWLLAGWLAKTITRLCDGRNMDPMLSRFLGGVSKVLVLIFTVILALDKFGISLGPFVAALGALTLGASFAVQGILSNYGAGLTIIMTRPFTLGHTVTMAGVRGVVEDITLASTILITEDGEKIMIPNKHIVGEILTNSFAYSVVETKVGISYNSDPEAAIEAINNALKNFEDIPEEPASQIGIEAFADSSINIGVRYWAPTIKYYDLQYKVNLAIYKALKEVGVEIPYPQRDVRIIKETEGS
ncbi:MscS Mechanosensitive ion channel [Desulfatibacillum aliphaticivorans]|uniref:MscS Mechanosensitive ion channel n=2 Tax=Desulfatibacillum aliphaticivorans TaxID=218208 RepID=B8FAI5_DESAL|nr:MscS Mechanosensitive ion channel [Desulfatibacillum aliphaticivorans]